MKVISTTKAPAAIGPYSQAIVSGDFLFLSGQIPVDPTTGMVVEGSIEEQAHQVMKNIGEVLNEAGTDWDHVVKTTCFIDDMNNFAKFNEVYEGYFISKPARSCVEASKLPKNVMVEIEVIASMK
ncbi:MAG: RidA family protein [Hespellia sp.]|jgi:2-iminobutanoate/2-iminopropanoate deaminase|nr:RidA family protein [Hespellia sp.]